MPRPAVFVPLLVGVATAVGLGVYGQVHDPTGRALYTAFFSETGRFKSWLSTVAVVGVVAQASMAFGLWRLNMRNPESQEPTRLSSVHKLVGSLTFMLTLPVAYHCLWALGYQSYSTRVAVHSLLGCAFYGAYAAKVTAARRPDTNQWMTPAVGAAVFLLTVAVWWTGARWYFVHVSWGL